MNQPLREAFARELDDAGRLDLDVQAVVDQGEVRLRRRRLALVVGGTVAVVVAITIGVGIALNGPTTRSQGPSHRPPAQGTKNAGTDDAPLTRQIVYGDYRMGVGRGMTVHFGDHVVETGNDEVHLDVTDDGFLYTDRGGVWLSDGSAPVRVGSTMCPKGARGLEGHFNTGGVMTAVSGSTAAWVDCTRAARPTLVVFDTSSHHEVASRPVTSCCDITDITNDYVYVGNDRFDLRANRLRASTPHEYAEDLRSHPRGLILGNDWESGTPIGREGRLLADDGALRFAPVGSRLVPVLSVDTDHHHVTSAFNTATGRALRLRLPADYQVENDDSFVIFEWLDDDTVALSGGRADILTCRLSTGRCIVAVTGPDADTWRIIPTFPLPG